MRKKICKHKWILFDVGNAIDALDFKEIIVIAVPSAEILLILNNRY